MPGPKLEPLVLSAEERQVLEGRVRRRKTSQALARRSRIVLACADGASVTAVAAGLKVSRDAVSNCSSTTTTSLRGGGRLPEHPCPSR